MLTRNADIVQVAPYDTAFAGAGTGGTGSSLSLEGLGYGQKYRIRQPGTVEQVKLYIASLTNVTGFYLKIWRRVRSAPTDQTWLFNLIGTTENLLPSLTAGQLNTVTLSSPIAGVQEGDYYGYRITASVANNAVITARSGQTGADTYVVLNQDPDVTNYAWLTKFISAGSIIPFEFYMQAPTAVVIGDSIIAGFPGHQPYLSYPPFDDVSGTIGSYFSVLTNYVCVYQNMGFPGQKTADIAARFAADCTALKPRYAIINGGVNDIANGVSQGDFITNWTTILNACVAAGIVPVVCLIAPWSAGSNVQLQKRDTWNTALTALAAGYTSALVVNFDSSVGQYRSGGDAGNLWDIQDDCDCSDGIHFSGRGHYYIAKAIYHALGYDDKRAHWALGGRQS